MRVKSRPQSPVAKFVMSRSFQDHVTKKRNEGLWGRELTLCMCSSHTAEVPRSRAFLALVLHLFSLGYKVSFFLNPVKIALRSRNCEAYRMTAFSSLGDFFNFFFFRIRRGLK